MWFGYQYFSVFAIFIFLALFLLFAFELGYRLSLRLYRDKQSSEIPNFGQVSAGLIGMLAFVLAFTFSMAANQYTNRKQMVLEEANAIGTAYLRSDLLEKTYSSKMKEALKNYVDIRIVSSDMEKAKQAIKTSQEIHKVLWELASKAAINTPNTNTSLVIQSVNEVIDIHEKRVTVGIRDMIPNSIWITLFMISILSMISLGLESGLTRSRKLIVIIPLILAFTSLMTLIADLNRPQEGTLKVSQEVMYSLQESIREDLQGSGL